MQKKSFFRRLPAVLCALILVSCAGGPAVVIPPGQLPPFPPARFAVFSDSHLHTPALGMIGKAFWNDVNEGKKLLHLSEELLEATVIAIIADPGIEFVIVPGDLTRDGELENHRRMAFFLGTLEAAGKKVYVVPGNHDIMNPHARRFTDQGPEPVPSVSPPEFASLYGAYGYDEAIDRDPASLSYVAEPVPGLWLFGLDACTYEWNAGAKNPSTGGRFKRETMDWVLALLERARAEHKAVIGVMHHGLLEHFPSQKKYFKDFVVEDWEWASRTLASAGLRFMFTGHFHAQDIVMKRFTDAGNGPFLFDIETSSLVTWPCAWRICDFTADNRLAVESRPVLSLPSTPDFAGYARGSLVEGVEKYLDRLLARYGVSENDRRLLAPQLVKGLMAHTAGDENPPAVLIDRTGLSLGANILVSLTMDLADGAWHDPPPLDNSLVIDCATGEWREP